MRIVCPSCAAIYDVPGTALAPGRAVRCARCGTEWAPVPAEAPRPAASEAVRGGSDRAIVIPPAPEPEPVAGPAIGASTEAMPGGFGHERAGQRLGNLATRQRPIRATPVTAWIASLAILAGLVAAAYAWRAPIMTAWPPSERLYAALGLVHAGGGASR